MLQSVKTPNKQTNKTHLFKIKHFGITDSTKLILTIPLVVSRTPNKIDKTANKNGVKRRLCF